MQSLVESSEKNTTTSRRQEQRKKLHTKSQEIHQPLKDENNFTQVNIALNTAQSVNDDDDLDFFEDIR